jgi:DNA-binding winged helix-turn-helix (wHTH) protein/tetratricopeptide (TPR) repeat protein
VILAFGDVELDLDRYELRRAGSIVAVEPQVFDVLVHLARNADRVVSKEELLDTVWGDRFVSESALTSRIKSARRSVGDDGRRQQVIATAHGRGYRLVAAVRTAESSSDPIPADAAQIGGARLLERASAAAELTRSLAAAAAGAGRVVLVAGEAGIGKTTLVQRFQDEVGGRATVLAGAADDLSTPRVLGPIRDLVDQLPGHPVLDELHGEQLLTALEGIASETRLPIVVIVEDLHWADDATLDVVRYVARRVRAMPVVLVLTYRDEAIEVGHPLRRVLALMRGPQVTRILLEPLTVAAVTEMAAGTALDPEEVFSTTGGNPLFVTEVLVASPGSLPSSVRDAVLARVGRLDADTRDALRRLAVVPAHVDRDLARDLVGRRDDAWTDAERAGLLDGDSTHIWFRHELVRRAVEETLTASERVGVHAEVAERLHDAGAEPSRVVHHATLGNAVDLVVSVGPIAAAEAQRTGAHRQAAQHLATVLEHRDRLSSVQQAELESARAHSLYMVNRFEESLTCAHRAVEAAEASGDPDLLTRALLGLGRTVLWARGPAVAVGVEQRALSVLGDDGDRELCALVHADLARALGELVSVGAVAQGSNDALEHASRALELAKTLARDDLRGYALMYRGSERLALGDADGRADLDEAVAVLRTLSRVDFAVRACVNASGSAYRAGRYTEAERYVELGFELAQDAEFFSGEYRLALTRACVRATTGRWSEAEAELTALLAADGEPGIMEPLARSVLARLLARRGCFAEADETLRPAEAAASADEIRLLAPVTIARVELSWLAPDDGDLGADREMQRVLDACANSGHTVLQAELSRYLQRSGGSIGPFEEAPQPWASGLRGDWRDAARRWDERGDRYEHALELLAGDDRDAHARGHDMLASLGADGTVAAVAESR